MSQFLDGAVYKRMILNAAAATELQKKRINELNVFPVPDGDTGTNMSMTLCAAAADLRKHDAPSLAQAADLTASALLRGARGNSGVILSLLFGSVFSRLLKAAPQADGRAFADALSAGVEKAYKAVMNPAEGTILTVSRVTADCARDLAEENRDITYVLENALVAARAALDNTVNQNPVLKKAGVVDAGGMGFVVMLEGMLQALHGSDLTGDVPTETHAQADFSAFDSEEITYAFDTVFILRRSSDVSLEPLRQYLSAIGDSLVIGESDDAFKVHVHTNDPADAMREAQKYGTLELAKIENMRMQHDDLAAGRKAKSTDDLDAEVDEMLPQPVCVPAEKEFGAVAVCAGSGLADVFRDLGVDQIIQGGQTMNPSTEDILEAIEKTPAETVFVLPNNKNIIMAAEAAAGLSSRNVIVIGSKTVPQGMAALLCFEPDRSAEENREAMSAALPNVTTMQITYAARNSDFDGFAICEGDYLGLVNGALLGTTRELRRMLTRMADSVQENGNEFVTIFYGSDIAEEDAEQALEIFRTHAPDAEINLVYGGQPIYYYLISAE